MAVIAHNATPVAPGALVYVPPAYLKLFDGPATTTKDLWQVLGRPVVNGGFIVGTIIKPKLGLRPQPFADACYDFWLGGDFIKNDEPQGNQVFAPFKEPRRPWRRDLAEFEARLGADPVAFAKDHREFARAFERFPHDPDTLFPGWRAKLGKAAA